MTSRVEIGAIICKARKNFNYSQKEMAQKSGVNASTISEIENGHFTGSFDIFERLMNAVGLQFEVVAKKNQLPDWDEIDMLFSEEDK